MFNSAKDQCRHFNRQYYLVCHLPSIFVISPPKTRLATSKYWPPDISWIVSPGRCWQDLESGRHCRCCRFPRPSHPRLGSSSPNGALPHCTGGQQATGPLPLGVGERVWRGGGERHPPGGGGGGARQPSSGAELLLPAASCRGMQGV